MQLISTLSLAVLSALALQGVDAAGFRQNIAIVHGNAAQPSANYLSLFARDDAPEPAFELVDDVTIKSKLISLKSRGEQCSEWYKVNHGDTCHIVADKYGIHLNDFYLWNPSVNKACTNLKAGKSYCVGGSGSSIEDHCSQRHKVTWGDTCTKIANKYGISRSEFYSLNSGINSGCTNLKTGHSYCVAASGGKKQAPKEEDEVSKKIQQQTTHLAAKTKPQQEEPKEEPKSEEEVVATKIQQKSTNLAAKTKPQQEEPKAEEPEEETSTEKRKLIHSNIPMTYYWIAQPQDYEQGGKTVAIKTCSGQTLGYTSQKYADALVMEGTGVLGNKIVNLGACSCSNYNCFMEVNKNEDPYGLTSYSTALRPFITAAANDIPRGTKVYVPQLVGWDIPGSNKKHNGCLVVDDKGWSFSSRHLDFFVYSMSNYKKLNGEHGVSKIDVYEGGGCNLINYL